MSPPFVRQGARSSMQPGVRKRTRVDYRSQRSYEAAAAAEEIRSTRLGGDLLLRRTDKENVVFSCDFSCVPTTSLLF